MLKAARATCDFYHREYAHGRHSLLGHRRAGAPPPRRLPGPPRRVFNDFEPVDSSAAAIAAQGLLRLGHYLGKAGRRPLFPSGAHRARYPLRRSLPQHAIRTIRAHPALDLPSAQRLGSHPGGREDAARRVQHVGRLPRPRSRAVRAAPGEERALLHLLRRDPSKLTSHDHRRPRQNRRPPLPGAPPHPKPGGRRPQPIKAKNFSFGHVTLDPRWRPGALAQPGAGGNLLHYRRHRRNVPGRGAPDAQCRADGLHPSRRLPPVDQYRRHPAAHDLHLRAGRRCGPLAPGARRHTSRGRRKRLPPLPAGAPPAVHRQTRS